MHPNPIVCIAEAGELESCRLRFEELDTITLTGEYICDNVIYDDFNLKKMASTITIHVIKTTI